SQSAAARVAAQCPAGRRYPTDIAAGPGLQPLPPQAARCPATGGSAAGNQW
nr:hypothetical protein [Tanacetum cinerariifolium]